MEAHARGNEVRLSGDRESVDLAKAVLEQLYEVLRSGRSVRSRDVADMDEYLELVRGYGRILNGTVSAGRRTTMAGHWR